jgi:AAA+ ATPase superfamily predicted ATPase
MNSQALTSSPTGVPARSGFGIKNRIEVVMHTVEELKDASFIFEALLYRHQNLFSPEELGIMALIWSRIYEELAHLEGRR